MRYYSVDILRAVAIVVMVFVHFAENLSQVLLPFAGLGAPMFALLSGVSYRLWVNGQEARGVAAEQVSRISVRRGLFVFGVGIAFNVLVWLPEDTFNWDVLTFIGSALLILNLLRPAALPVHMTIAVASLAIAPVLRYMADYPSYWQAGYFECDLTLNDVLVGYLTTGYFPLFPWLTYSIAGYVIGALMLPQRLPGEAAPRPAVISTGRVVGIGALLLTLGQLALSLHPVWPEMIAERVLTGWSMFPPSTEYVASTLGMGLILLGLLHRFVDQSPRDLSGSGALRLAKVFSRNAFTLYIAHHVVHLWPLWIVASFEGRETTYHWRRALPLGWSMTLAAAFLLLTYVLLRRVDPDRRYGIEGWMRWLCDH
ncbi:MAG: heparan-alpha-glucosaminide N-acetyltransferase domain-containing protein [Planctomycetaceae bacterium]